MKEPKRTDFPPGKEGEKQYKQAMVDYKKWLKENSNTDTKMDLPAIQLPGLPRNPSDVEAKNWFKFVAPRAAKGSEARKYYDSITAILQKSGIAKKDWASVWADAVDWTQTLGNDSNGDPRKFFNTWNPGDYTGSGSQKQYGTTKNKQTTVTEYSTSSAAADITSAYKAEMGREAGATEISAYQKAVNEAAKKEPAVYTSTTTTAPGKGGVISTSTSTAVSQTGFDPTRFAVEYARSNPDFAENFAVKNFIKLIDQALTDPNRIGTVVQ